MFLHGGQQLESGIVRPYELRGNFAASVGEGDLLLLTCAYCRPIAYSIRRDLR